MLVLADLLSACHKEEEDQPRASDIAKFIRDEMAANVNVRKGATSWKELSDIHTRSIRHFTKGDCATALNYGFTLLYDIDKMSELEQQWSEAGGEPTLSEICRGL